jgi:lipopolysaccharide transport system ATP-binding protein
MNGRVASLLEVGTGFHPELSGRENIYMNGAIMGMTKQEIKSKFDEIVDFSGCERFIDTPVKRYSSGMYVRLAFAVAAHLEPEILIVDEVLAVGDAEFQKKCLGKMDQVSKNDGRTVLFVSHNMTAIRTLCQKGIMLKNGILFGDGNIEKIISTYESDQIENIRVADLKNRDGNGLLKFLDIKFYDKNGIEKKDFFVGESLQVQVYFKAHPSFFQSNSSCIDIDINNTLNNRIGWMSSSIYSDRLDSNRNYITFKIDKILLAQGSYNFNLFSKNSLGIADFIQNVSMINIIYDDYYGTGKKIPESSLSMITEYSVKQ